MGESYFGHEESCPLGQERGRTPVRTRRSENGWRRTMKGEIIAVGRESRGMDRSVTHGRTETSTVGRGG